MLVLLALLAATAFPSRDLTSWMRPESFHLSIGMPRAEALNALTSAGLKVEKGDDADHVVVDYTPTQALTLEFRKERLRSIRFELYRPVAQIRTAFEEEKAWLRAHFGEPRPVKSDSMVIHDGALPNVMAVVSHDGMTRLATLLVRYYDPASPSPEHH